MKEIIESNNQQNTEKFKEKVNKNKIKAEFFGKNYEFETNSYNFKYPEKNQKETGILGYKRTIVTGIEKVIVDYCKSFNFGVDKMVGECADLESMLFMLEKIYYDKIDEKDIVNTNILYDPRENFWNGKEGLFYKSLYDLGRKIITNFDLILSKGEFPSRTLNHSLGAFHEEGEKNGILRKRFVQDKFFLQKLFDVGLSKEVKLDARIPRNKHIEFDVYNKSNGDFINETSPENLRIYQERIEKNQIFLIGYDAFNTRVAYFWENGHKKPSFGFSLKDDFFRKYIQKAYEIFLKNNTDTKKEIIGIHQIIKMITFCDNDFYEKYKKMNPESQNDLSKKINKLRKDFLPDIDQDKAILDKKVLFFNKNNNQGYFTNYENNKRYPDNYNEFFIKQLANILDPEFNQCIPGHSKGFFTEFLKQSIGPYSLDSKGKEGEIFLPIFINHKEIPQISWGHAKYAHFINKKGLNFFEFEHDDHLPKVFDWSKD